jgi:hypothetical protein
MLMLSASALLVLPVLLLLPFSSRLALKAKYGYQLTDIPETFMDFFFVNRLTCDIYIVNLSTFLEYWEFVQLTLTFICLT